MPQIIHIDARNSIFNEISGNQSNFCAGSTFHEGYNCTSPESADSATPPVTFNDAPVDFISTHFMGRDKELEITGEYLEVTHDNAPTHCAISGMAGIGKTQLILQYAKQSFDRNRYSFVFWMSGATEEKLNQGFAHILDLINHPACDHHDQNRRLTATKRWLEECQQAWLILIDNVRQDALPFLRHHLPHRNKKGSILFTARSAELARAITSVAGQQYPIIELRPPSLADAAALLIGEAGISAESPSYKRAEDVVKCVGCLPLAIAQAGTFARLAKNTLDDLLGLYQSDEMYQIISWENDLSSYEQKSVAATFISQLKELKKRSPVASTLLKVLSFLDPERIPVRMLIDAAGDTAGDKTPEDVLAAKFDVSNTEVSSALDSLMAIMRSPVQMQHAIQELQNMSLVRLKTRSGSSILRIHDLLQATIQERAKTDNRHHIWFRVAVALICALSNKIDNPVSFECWARCEQVGPHFQSLMSWDMTHKIGNPDLLDASRGMAAYLHSRGRYSEAEGLIRWELEGDEKRLGPNDLGTLRTAQSLAVICRLLGRYEEAEMIYRRVLKGREEQLGLEDTDTLATLQNLAIVCDIQNRYEEAEQLYGRVLAGREKSLEHDHLDVLRTVQNLAIVHQRQGRHDSAESLYGRVLVGREKALGPDHMDTLRTVHNIANVFQLQGRYDEAESMYLRVLSGRERKLGKDHPHTLETLESLANVYELQGRADEAHALYRRALDGNERMLGMKHPNTLHTVKNMVHFLQNQGRLGEAECMRERLSDDADYESPHCVVHLEPHYAS
ncbi:TPR-like protein [Athelia psychrophila]|uniref:TPR-like protein n=1 Tax=Athelia psychrophila TaxID=1759441 RepID=A0A166DUF3_9AGAM|nr:TPR-like protein [Fibularhizoctonia sp. CBS 109695]KZP15080.1 TPR-like protein [Fibularhizoctonia sp. CBS 109695]